MADGRFARVYFDEIARDVKFDGIRNDRDVMGSWLLLLIEAEKAWPAPAFRPPASWVPNKHVSLFAERQLVDLQADGRYVVHGLDSERKGRSDKARHAATTRWEAAARSSADALPVAMPVAMPRARAVLVSSDSSSSVLPEGGVGGDDGRADLEAFLAVRYRAPSPAQRRLMDDYIGAFDVTGPERAAELILKHPDDPIGALKEDLSAFRKERVAQMVEKRVARRPRKGTGMSAVNTELARLMASPSLITSAHNSGAHADTADPRCRYCQESAALA